MPEEDPDGIPLLVTCIAGCGFRGDPQKYSLCSACWQVLQKDASTISDEYAINHAFGKAGFDSYHTAKLAVAFIRKYGGDPPRHAEDTLPEGVEAWRTIVRPLTQYDEFPQRGSSACTYIAGFAALWAQHRGCPSGEDWAHCIVLGVKAFHVAREADKDHCMGAVAPTTAARHIQCVAAAERLDGLPADLPVFEETVLLLAAPTELGNDDAELSAGHCSDFAFGKPGLEAYFRRELLAGERSAVIVVRPPETYCVISSEDGAVALRDSHRRLQLDFNSLDAFLRWLEADRAIFAAAAACPLELNCVGLYHLAEARRNTAQSEADECYQPGLFEMIQGSLVTDGPARDSAEVAKLLKGATVNVLEVVTMPEIQRVRARIEAPNGWISLLNTSSGLKWAVRKASAHTTQASVPMTTADVDMPCASSQPTLEEHAPDNVAEHPPSPLTAAAAVASALTAAVAHTSSPPEPQPDAWKTWKEVVDLPALPPLSTDTAAGEAAPADETRKGNAAEEASNSVAVEEAKTPKADDIAQASAALSSDADNSEASWMVVSVEDGVDEMELERQSKRACIEESIPHPSPASRRDRAKLGQGSEVNGPRVADGNDPRLAEALLRIANLEQDNARLLSELAETAAQKAKADRDKEDVYIGSPSKDACRLEAASDSPYPPTGANVPAADVDMRPPPILEDLVLVEPLQLKRRSSGSESPTMQAARSAAIAKEKDELLSDLKFVLARLPAHAPASSSSDGRVMVKAAMHSSMQSLLSGRKKDSPVAERGADHHIRSVSSTTEVLGNASNPSKEVKEQWFTYLDNDGDGQLSQSDVLMGLCRMLHMEANAELVRPVRCLLEACWEDWISDAQTQISLGPGGHYPERRVTKEAFLRANSGLADTLVANLHDHLTSTGLMSEPSTKAAKGFKPRAPNMPIEVQENCTIF